MLAEPTGAAHSVGAYLDTVAIWITHVHTVALAPGAEQRGGTHLDRNTMLLHKGIEGHTIGHERDMVNVATGRLVGEQIDQRVGIDTQRHKRRLTRPPLV